MSKSRVDFKSLNTELDEILSQLQSEDLDIEEAVKFYERGIAITKQLEVYLQEAENKVSQIKADFS